MYVYVCVCARGGRGGYVCYIVVSLHLCSKDLTRLLLTSPLMSFQHEFANRGGGPLRLLPLLKSQTHTEANDNLPSASLLLCFFSQCKPFLHLCEIILWSGL